MKQLSTKACRRIDQILFESRKRCHRTVIEVCVYADYESRRYYYKVRSGKSHDPVIYLRIGIGANVPAILFADYLEAANIVLSPRMSDENRLIWQYLREHSDDYYADYDIDELNDYLDAHGCERL
ncbi:MAG: hypothetical protein IK020_05325 [Clostridiales bacterium]|nr:hypothetical protein [Clostridiales bacterium]